MRALITFDWLLQDEMGDKSQPSFVPLPDNQVLISIPGDHSRKPPIGSIPAFLTYYCCVKCRN